MRRLCRLNLLIIVALFITGCSSIHSSLSPDKMQSELRESIEAPLNLTEGDSPFCAKPEIIVELPKPKPLVKIPEPFSSKFYFLLDKTEYTEESKEESVVIYEKILSNYLVEVVISGHTDTSASNEYNDDLAQRRAEKVRQDLINVGVKEEIIKISSEGEYRLLIATPDDTVEVKNRRVEIIAR